MMTRDGLWSHTECENDSAIYGPLYCLFLLFYATAAIQHENDRILDLMKRDYKIKDCIFAVNELKKACPNLTIRGQLIVGFSGESNSEFNDTLSLYVLKLF